MGTDFVNPNDVQVAGDHYKSTTGLQHWDLIEKYGHGYLEGYASKYLVRWPQKNGIEDLEKAKHVTEKLLHMHFNEGRRPRGLVPTAVLDEYIKENEIDRDTGLILTYLLQWQTAGDLGIAINRIQDLIDRELA